MHGIIAVKVWMIAVHAPIKTVAVPVRVAAPYTHKSVDDRI